jgi:hypothetical protein
MCGPISSISTRNASLMRGWEHLGTPPLRRGSRWVNPNRWHGQAPDRWRQLALKAEKNRAVGIPQYPKSRYPSQIAPCRHEMTLCVQTELSCHHWHHMASKERSCPLSFRPRRGGAAPIRLLASPTATVPRLGLSDDQQLFVTQLDAPASTVRTLNEGETHHRFSLSRRSPRHSR